MRRDFKMTFDDYLLTAIEAIGNARNEASKEGIPCAVDTYLRSAETCLWQAREVGRAGSE